MRVTSGPPVGQANHIIPCPQRGGLKFWEGWSLGILGPP